MDAFVEKIAAPFIQATSLADISAEEARLRRQMRRENSGYVAQRVESAVPLVCERSPFPDAAREAIEKVLREAAEAPERPSGKPKSGRGASKRVIAAKHRQKLHDLVSRGPTSERKYLAAIYELLIDTLEAGGE